MISITFLLWLVSSLQSTICLLKAVSICFFSILSRELLAMKTKAECHLCEITLHMTRGQLPVFVIQSGEVQNLLLAGKLMAECSVSVRKSRTQFQFQRQELRPRRLSFPVGFCCEMMVLNAKMKSMNCPCFLDVSRARCRAKVYRRLFWR